MGEKSLGQVDYPTAVAKIAEMAGNYNFAARVNEGREVKADLDWVCRFLSEVYDKSILDVWDDVENSRINHEFKLWDAHEAESNTKRKSK